MRPSFVPAASVPGVDLEAKLALAEFLLTSTDLQESARRAVDWLVAHSDAHQAVVAVVDALSGQVLLVAEHGVTTSAIADFVLSRDEIDHPLVAALTTKKPGRRR